MKKPSEFLSLLVFSMLLVFGACKQPANNNDKESNTSEPAFSIGTYSMERDDDQGSGELVLSEVPEGLMAELTVVGAGPSYNQGYIKGLLTLRNNNSEATLETTEFGNPCKLLFQLQDSTLIKVSTLEGDPASCGFGAGVMADGTYKLVDSTKGQLEPIDANDLTGHWRSTIDPTYELTLAEGKFTEYNRGEKVDELKYEFFENCPEDCFDGQLDNCLKAWNDRDTFCYVVLKANLQELEMSLLGGTGQSLVFERLK